MHLLLPMRVKEAAGRSVKLVSSLRFLSVYPASFKVEELSLCSFSQAASVIGIIPFLLGFYYQLYRPELYLV